MVRFYIMPIGVVQLQVPDSEVFPELSDAVNAIGQLVAVKAYGVFGEGLAASRGPKYLKWRFNPSGIDCPWNLLDYGLIAACIVAADVTQEQHEQLAAEADVAALPLEIDGNVSEVALPTVKAVLEALRIPAHWVTTDYTYRVLLRMVAGLFLFAQRYHGMHNEPLIDNTAQLDLRWNQIPLDRRQRIQATADALGYTYSAVTNTWLVRRILFYLAQQWADKPIHFGNLATL